MCNSALSFVFCLDDEVFQPWWNDADSMHHSSSDVQNCQEGVSHANKVSLNWIDSGKKVRRGADIRVQWGT